LKKFQENVDFDFSANDNSKNWNAYNFAVASKSNEMIEYVLGQGAPYINESAIDPPSYTKNMICSILTDDCESLLMINNLDLVEAYELSKKHEAQNCLNALYDEKITDIFEALGEKRDDLALDYGIWLDEKYQDKTQFVETVLRIMDAIPDNTTENKFIGDVLAFLHELGEEFDAEKIVHEIHIRGERIRNAFPEGLYDNILTKYWEQLNSKYQFPTILETISRKFEEREEDESEMSAFQFSKPFEFDFEKIAEEIIIKTK
jgi:hypothetical protein